MSRVLVAYFSAEGHTKKVAAKLSSAIGAELFEIRPELPYTKSDLNWMNRNSRSSVEMRNRASRPGIASFSDLSGTDVVFVGFPIWWYREPSVIDTFMESADLSGKTVVPFCTSGGSGPGDSAKNMQEIAPGADVREGARFSSSVSEDKLRIWAEAYLRSQRDE